MGCIGLPQFADADGYRIVRSFRSIVLVAHSVLKVYSFGVSIVKLCSIRYIV